MLVKDVALRERRRNAGHATEADDHHYRETTPYFRRDLVRRRVVEERTNQQAWVFTVMG